MPRGKSSEGCEESVLHNMRSQRCKRTEIFQSQYGQLLETSNYVPVRETVVLVNIDDSPVALSPGPDGDDPQRTLAVKMPLPETGGRRLSQCAGCLLDQALGRSCLPLLLAICAVALLEAPEELEHPLCWCAHAALLSRIRSLRATCMAPSQRTAGGDCATPCVQSLESDRPSRR